MDSDWMLADVHIHGYPIPIVRRRSIGTRTASLWSSDFAGALQAACRPAAVRQAQPPAPTLEQVQAMIDRRGPAGTGIRSVLAGGVSHQRAESLGLSLGAGSFLCGDAAHVHSPAGGGA